MPIGRDPADVVSPQVHQHDVFGPFLGVRQEVGLQGLVFLGGGPPGAGAGDGAVDDMVALQAHQDLG